MAQVSISELNERSRSVFRAIVDSYVATGEPVGSRAVAKSLDTRLSPASVRNVMADLEDLGLLQAPHTSAGRLPTDRGLRLYVDGLLEIGTLNRDERRAIEARCAYQGRNIEQVLSDVSETLSGLTRYAGMVMAPKTDRPFKHVELVPLSPTQALVVLVADSGMIENRLIDLPAGLPGSSLIEASNYLTARLNAGRSLAEVNETIRVEIESERSELSELTRKVVAAGLAVWSDQASERDEGFLIVRGQAQLLDDITNLTDLERIRTLFAALETKRNLLQLVEELQNSDGVQLFIGAETALFGLSGCSMVVAPYRAGGNDRQEANVVGAIGVIGPKRMNYARIIPMVNHTAQAVSRLLGDHEAEATG